MNGPPSPGAAPPFPKTLVLVPTYEERENIDTVLRQLRRAVPEASILVIDDCSADGTGDRASELAAELGQIDLLRRPARAGLGSAYRAGMAIALERGFERLVLMDADLSHDPVVLPSLLAAQSLERADLVIGSRYVRGGSVPDWPLHRRLLSRWGNTYVRVLLGLPLQDATSGYRVWTSKAVLEAGVLSTRAEGYGFVIESNYLAARCGLRIVEVPIRFTDRTLGKSKMSGRIVFEALYLVTRWGLRQRMTRRSAERRQPMNEP